MAAALLFLQLLFFAIVKPSVAQHGHHALAHHTHADHHTNPQLLVLVLSGGVQGKYNAHRAFWRLLIERVRPLGIHVYLISTLPGIKAPVADQETLHFPDPAELDDVARYDNARYVAMSTERYVETMNYILTARPSGHDARYILRTTLASFWHFPRLLSWLQTAPRTNFSAGVHVMIGDRLPIPSGAGFILSADVARSVAARSSELDRSTPDDVSLGRLLHKMNVPIVPMTRTDAYTANLGHLPTNCSSDCQFYHWRLKTGLPAASKQDEMQDVAMWASLFFYHYGPTMSMAHNVTAISGDVGAPA